MPGAKAAEVRQRVGTHVGHGERMPYIVLSGTLLLSALLLALVVWSSASAGGPMRDTPSLAATQISGELPPRDTQGTTYIQWGGGTRYQLTARLAVNGCNVDLFWVWDDAEGVYTGFTYKGPSFLNRAFDARYAEVIPPSTIWIRCAETNLEKPFSSLDGRTCGDHWYDEVKEAVLSRLATPPGTCMWRVTDPADSQAAFGRDSDWVNHERHGFWEYRRPDGRTPGQPFMSRPLDNHPIFGERGRMHPAFVQANHLCIGNIQWYLDKWLGESPENWRTSWYESPAGRAYLDRGIHRWEQQDDGSWTGSFDWKYTEPLLEAWNVCSYYVGFTGGAAPQSFVDSILTPEAIEWVEEFMFVLPPTPSDEERGVESPDREDAVSSGSAFEYTFHGEISEDHRLIFQARMKDSRDYYASLIGEELPGATINVYDPSHPARGCGTASQGSLSFYLYCAYIHDLPRPEVYARTTFAPFDSVAHEYLHLLQYHWAKIGHGGDAEPPVWLVEGAATYAAVQYLVERKGLANERARNYRVSFVKDKDETLAHWAREWGSGNGWEYSLAYLAYEWLVAHSDDDAWLTYWSQDWEDDSWRLGFEATFGLTLSDFYQEFEAWRGEGFPALPGSP